MNHWEIQIVVSSEMYLEGLQQVLHFDILEIIDGYM